MKRFLVLSAFVAALVGLSTRADAAAIYYSVQDVTDTASSGDLWEYSYFLDLGLAAGQGFRVQFSPDLGPGSPVGYRDLELLQVPNPTDWFDPFVIQPDPGLPDDGFLDGLLLPLAGVPAVQTSPFVVRFVWTGGPNGPGAQPFTLYSLNDINDPFGAITDAGGGTTQLLGAPAVVPEPGTLLLLGTGIAAAVRRRFRQPSRQVAD